jgi:hypothetical protein
MACNIASEDPTLAAMSDPAVLATPGRTLHTKQFCHELHAQYACNPTLYQSVVEKRTSTQQIKPADLQ